MTLQEMQMMTHQWIMSHGGYWDKRDMGLRCAEKAGGLARAVRAAPQDLQQMIGDLTFNVLAISNIYGMSIEQTFMSALDRYNMRFKGPISAEDE